MLSEVLREREVQIEHATKKKELVKMKDERFLQLQRKVRATVFVNSYS